MALDLTLFRRVRVVTVSRDGQMVVPDVGLCQFKLLPERNAPRRNTVHGTCYTPFQRVALSLVSGAPNSEWEGAEDRPYAPFPVSPGFSPLEMTNAITANSPEFEEFRLVVDRPVAHIRRTLEVREIRLKRYSMNPN